MKDVLLGCKRSKGNFVGKDEKNVEYDNVNLSVGKIDDFGMGVVKFDEYKIKTENFEEMIGLSIDDFLAMFSSNFFIFLLLCWYELLHILFELVHSFRRKSENKVIGSNIYYLRYKTLVLHRSENRD